MQLATSQFHQQPFINAIQFDRVQPCVQIVMFIITSIIITICLSIPLSCSDSLAIETGNKSSHQTNRNDDLSRNITLILENLLKNYDSSHHPEYDTGVPTVVTSNILVRSMGPFSEQYMDFSMDCYFRQSWQDRRLSFNGPIETLSLSIKMLEGIWKPDTFFYNGKKSYIHTITQPNKLLRIKKDGSILYSVRLTIKAKCPMILRDFPMDKQSCPLVLGSYGYTKKDLIYVWDQSHGVKFIGGVELSQFDLISSPYRNSSIMRKQDDYSVLQVCFNLRRKQGYFLIQIYIPCMLIVVLSWVSFWLNREATSDRVSLGITTVLTLSTLALDSRTDLPKVHYATALDWFILITYGYCIASLIQFAAVHFFTKIGSGEIVPEQEHLAESLNILHKESRNERLTNDFLRQENRSTQTTITTPIHTETLQTVDPANDASDPGSLTINIMDELEEAVQLNPFTKSKLRINSNHYRNESCLKQMFYCLVADLSFRQKRTRQALLKGNVINSVSKIDRVSRILFPLTFLIINAFYWWGYVTQDDVYNWSAVEKLKYY